MAILFKRDSFTISEVRGNSNRAALSKETSYAKKMKKLPQVDKMLFARDTNGNIASFAVIYDSYTVHQSPGMIERDIRETAALLDSYPSQYVIRLREQPLSPLNLSTPHLLQMTCSSESELAPEAIVSWAKTMIT